LAGRWAELRVTPPVWVRDPGAEPCAPEGPEATLVVKAGDEARVCVAATTWMVGVAAESHPARPAACSEFSATCSS
jgi:hypothetical protein